jgi:hypothetical protein
MRVTALIIAAFLLPSGFGKPSASPGIPARHDEAMEHIDESEILQHHDPDPISYYQYDYENAEPGLPATELTAIRTDARHGGLILFHAFALTIGYLMVLPTRQFFGKPMLMHIINACHTRYRNERVPASSTLAFADFFLGA